MKNLKAMRKQCLSLIFLSLASSLLPRTIFARDIHWKRPWSLDEIGVFEAWRLAGRQSQGEGIRILDIGSGVDINVPGIGRKIEKGMNLGDYAATTPEDLNPFHDQRGHGTTIAGTLVGDLTSRGLGGVAPKARILVGKVPETSVEVDWVRAITKGIRWGISENVDVINLSILTLDDGEPGLPQAYQELKSALYDAYKMGIVMIASAGNNGKGTLDFIARQPEVLSVGAVDSDFVRAPFSQYGPELGVMAPGVSILYSLPLGAGRTSQLVITKDKGIEFRPVSVGYVRSPCASIHGELQYAGEGDNNGFTGFRSGNIAVVQQTFQGPTDKTVIEHATESGARGLIFVNYTLHLTGSYASLVEAESKIPVVYVNRSQGKSIEDRLLKKEMLQATIETKPSDTSIFSGTSGSAPLVSGVAALMKGVNRKLGAEEIYKIIQETSTFEPSDNNQYGSGVINAAAAVRAALEAR